VAIYYFWVQDGDVEQQVEVYDVGVMIAYDRCHVDDEYRALSAVALGPDE